MGFFFNKLWTLNSTEPGLFKWCSRLYRNQGSLFFAPAPLDWGEQIIVVTGGEFTCEHSLALIGSFGIPDPP
jgi:hypothetical protein